MFSRVLRFVRLALVLILVWAAARFAVGLSGMPYAPRGNAMFSIVGLMFISCLYFGAMSKRVGGFGWLGTLLCGVTIGLWAQILIFTLTLVSLSAGLNTYFVHWDALNIPEGTQATMGEAMKARAGGLLFGSVFGGIAALIGRAVFGLLSPRCGHDE